MKLKELLESMGGDLDESSGVGLKKRAIMNANALIGSTKALIRKLDGFDDEGWDPYLRAIGTAMLAASVLVQKSTLVLTMASKNMRPQATHEYDELRKKVKGVDAGFSV